MRKETLDKYREEITKILGTDKWRFTENQYTVPCEQCKHSNSGNYRLCLLDDKGQDAMIVSSFQLVQMVNCCGIMVSTVARIEEGFRHKGLGTLLNKMRMDLARDLGYTVLMCTDVTKNEYQRKILAKNGWEDIYKLVNKRTSNEIAISVIKL